MEDKGDGVIFLRSVDRCIIYSLPVVGHWACRYFHCVCDRWPVWRQTSSHLTSHRTSPYQIKLLGDRGAHEGMKRLAHDHFDRYTRNCDDRHRIRDVSRHFRLYITPCPGKNGPL